MLLGTRLKLAMDAYELGTPALTGKFVGRLPAGAFFGKSVSAGPPGIDGTPRIDGIPGWVGSLSRMDDIELDGFDGILG